MAKLNVEVGDQVSKESTFLQKHGTKLFALLFWVLIVGGYALYAYRNDLTVAESIKLGANVIIGSAWGPIIYIILYALRPLLFFPASIITLLAGFLFGPWGILYTVVGSNSSAMVAYGVGRYFGQGVLEEGENAGIIQQYTQRMRNNSFETVLIMRLIFLPYDLVNYLAGFLQIDWKAFLLATAIGSIPGTISIVLLGTSFGTLDELLAGNVEVNPITLVASIVLVIVSIALSRYAKRREAVKE